MRHRRASDLARAALLVCLGATLAVLFLLPQEASRRQSAADPPPRKSDRSPAPTPRMSPSERKVNNLSLESTQTRLPEALPEDLRDQPDEDTLRLLRRFGKLKREDAPLQIMGRYGTGPNARHAILVAFEGWAEVDPDASRAALAKALDPAVFHPFAHSPLKSRDIHEQIDAELQVQLEKAMREATQ